MWEYMTLLVTYKGGVWYVGKETLEKALNSMGKEGWEFVQMVPDPRDFGWHTAIFKRNG